MATDQLKEIETRYANGIELLRKSGYYDRLIEEVHLLVKYFDNNYFFQLLTENLFDDFRGVFHSFVNRDLKLVFRELEDNPTQSLENFLNREYTSLSILKSCTMNVNYQVSGLMRLEQTRKLQFKSTFLQFISRKLNGEIQALYKELSHNYKKYFRKQFIFSDNSGSHVSLVCMEKLDKEFQAHFLTVMQKFYHLYEALNFVHDLFIFELRKTIYTRISSIFYENQEKMSKLLNYFIEDLKQNFIRMLDKNMRKGKDYPWIQNTFTIFLESERFQKMLSRVISQSINVMYDRYIRQKSGV